MRFDSDVPCRWLPMALPTSSSPSSGGAREEINGSVQVLVKTSSVR